MRFLRLPEAVDLAASALLSLALVALGLASNQWLVLVPLMLASVAASVTKPRLRAEPGRMGYGLLALAFALAARLVEVQGTSGFGVNVPYYIGFFLVTIAVVKLFSPPSAGALPATLFGSASAIASVGADVPLPHPGWKYPTIVALSALPAVIVARGALGSRDTATSRKTWVRVARLAAVFGFLLVALGLTFGLARLLDTHYNEINNFVLRRARALPASAAGGFTATARLGDIAHAQNDDLGHAVALRAFSKKPPGYLRGMTFVDYADRQWSSAAPRQEETVRSNDEAPARYVLPGRAAPGNGRDPDMTIYPASRYEAHYFLPLETGSIETPNDHVIVRPGGALSSPFEPTTSGYDVFLDSQPVRASSDEPTYRELPRDPKIIEALDSVLAKLSRHDPSIEDAERALRVYFAGHYAYRVGIEFAPGSDPIVQFLKEKEHGHCELFATAGVLLLRRMGFAARYVTGFICEEQNGRSDMWIARAKHAHAWVEVDEGTRGWRTLELTPPAGIASVERTSGFDSFIQSLRGAWDRFFGAIARRGLAGILRAGLIAALAWLVASPWRIAFLVFVSAGVGLRFLLRRRAAGPKAPPPRVFPEELARAREDFFRLERTLARSGLGKREAETLLEYASRLEQARFDGREAAAAVRAFAGRRYARF